MKKQDLYKKVKSALAKLTKTNSDFDQDVEPGSEAQLPAVDDSASNRVLQQVGDFNELLELILLHVPNRTLLLAQRVNRKWAAVIGDTPSLQRKLFFRPSGPEILVIRSDRKHYFWRQWIHIPKLWYVKTVTLWTDQGKLNKDRKRLCHSVAKQLQTNPLVGRVFEPSTMQLPCWDHCSMPTGTGCHCACDILPGMLIPLKKVRSQAIDYKNASWKRMLYIQPPITYKCLARSWTEKFGGKDRKLGRKMPDGTRIKIIDLPKAMRLRLFLDVGRMDLVCPKHMSS